MNDKCINGHTWSNTLSADWIPDEGTSCDCGQKVWKNGVLPSDQASKFVLNPPQKLSRKELISESSIARIAGNILSGLIQDTDSHLDSSRVSRAVRLARMIAVEVEQTKPK